MKYEVNKKLSVGYICDYSSIHSKKHSDWWLMYWKSFDGLHKYCQQGCPHLIKLRNTFLHKLYYKMFFWHFFWGDVFLSWSWMPWLLTTHSHTWYLSRAPRAYPYKFCLAGVNFYRFYAKNWQFTVYFAVITQKNGNLLCILS